MDLKLTFKVNEKELRDLLEFEIDKMSKKLHEQIVRGLPLVIKKIRTLTRRAIKNGPMYRGLVFGDLAGHFGIPAEKVIETANSIVEVIENSIEINFAGTRSNSKKLLGQITVVFFPRGFNKLVNAEFATVITEKGEELNWLDWTLFRGDETIIYDYNIYFEGGKGRSGLAIMVPSHNVAGSWKVPSKVSGTEDDNWITRSLDKIQKKYSDIIYTAISLAYSKIK